MKYHVLMHRNTWQKAKRYLEFLSSGNSAGAFLQAQLPDKNRSTMQVEEFIERLMRTKQPQIFAETAVSGAGDDWNRQELSILGDISVAMPVTIFDNGRHRNPEIHQPPFEGHLIFTPGALLQNGTGGVPADWEAITRNGKIDLREYCELYERRLFPAFAYANEVAGAKNKMAFITIPGLGCGQFAGVFRGKLGAMLGQVLKAFLEKHGAEFPHIKAVYYDPFDECGNSRMETNRIQYLIRPLNQGNQGKPQLCKPETYAEKGDEFAECEFFSIVAWDHVSWPGNDFYGGSRATDDGVKAAATNSMEAMTGVRGSYDVVSCQYRPPTPFSRWQDVIFQKKIQLVVRNNIKVYP
ncbi:MAG: hypothetical protein WA705_15245 [Candidatus Ozemobacteraceae bacterium]